MGEKVNLIFLIAAPNTKENVHLDVLSKLSVLLMDEDFTANLRNAKTVDEFLHVIDAAEAEKDAEEEKPLHKYFGTGENDVMKRLNKIREDRLSE